MLQQDEPEDFVIATGQQTSVREFINVAANHLGIKLIWRGAGSDEEAVVDSVEPSIDDLDLHVQPGDIIVRVDKNYYRPAEVDALLGDPTKAHEKLGWQPKTSFTDMVREMLLGDLDQARRHALLKSQGFDIATPRE